MPINRSCKKVSNYVKKFLMRPCKKVEIGEYLASEKFSTARIHFSIFQSRKLLMTFTSLKVEPTALQKKSFVSTSVNVNNVSTDLRSLRDYCPHTSFNRVNSKNRSYVLVTPFKFICSTIKNGGRRV